MSPTSRRNGRRTPLAAVLLLLAGLLAALAPAVLAPAALVAPAAADGPGVGTPYVVTVGATVELEREDGEALAELSIAVSADVDEASRSERANIRARGVGGVHDENAQRWWGLERATYLSRDLLDVLSQHERLDERHGDPQALATAMRSVADLLATPPGDAETGARTDAAWRDIDAYGASLPAPDEATDTHDQPGLWLAATLGRMTDISIRVSDALP